MAKTTNVSELSEAAEFPTSIDTPTADTVDEATLEKLTDPTPATTTQGALPVTPVQTNKVVAAPVVYEEVQVIDQSTVKMSPIARVEGTATSSSSSPAQMASAVSKVTTSRISPEQLTEQVKKYLDNYIRMNTSAIKPFETQAQAKASIDALHSVVRFAVNNPLPAILQEIYIFFRNNRNGVLDPMYALQGIQNLKKEDGMVVQIFYQVFYNITDPKRKPISLEVARNVFAKSGDAIINFVTAKLN